MSESSTPLPDYTYLNQRLQELGISDKENTFHRVWQSNVDSKDEATGKINTTPTMSERDYKILDADAAGNIVIHYFNLLGQPYRWKHEEKKWTADYIRKRLKDPKTDMKYYQEPGSPQFPFFPKGIIEKYKEAIAYQAANDEEKKTLGDTKTGEIATLFVVEGEIKSIKGSLCGIDIIGIPSIHGFYNGDVKGRLHEDIEELIIRCKVQKIVFLVDADLYTVKWAEGKDLAKRPTSFLGSVRSFRESLQLLMDNDDVPLQLVYFMDIKIKYLNDAKGLDDLLCKYTAKTMEIVEDLLQLNFARKYFNGQSILDISKDIQGRLFKDLGLFNEQDFYKTYTDFIGNREFRFKRRRYIYDSEKKEVVFVKHEDAEKFMRIGPDWVKVITKKNKHDEMEEELVSWKISEIQRDYAKKFPDFIETIVRYDDFCNEPRWDNEYQQSIHGCYNVCRPLKMKPKEGSITNTVGFLKHLFGGKGNIILDDQGRFESEDSFIGDQFTVALDYLTIMMKHPKQMLPVPCLVSPENGTGKSTFLKWLQMIFGDNMCILGNAQFQMKFNGHYATKFIISIDEGFLEVDKKAEKERLKQLVTADSIYLEHKGMNVRKIAYYAKLIICSNDADRVMKIEEGESRWFVVRVPVIPKEKKDPDLELKMKSEAEAWLHFIMNRQIVHPRQDRLWFLPEHFITDQFKIIVETTKNRIDRVFEQWIRDQFLLFKQPVLRYTLTYLTQVFNDPKTSKYKIDELDLRKFLSDKGMHPEKESIYHKSPKGFKETIYTEGTSAEPMDSTPQVTWWAGTGRPYTFRAEEWITAEECQRISVLPPDLTTVKEPEIPIEATNPEPANKPFTLF
jgi:hypothetical protein